MSPELASVGHTVCNWGKRPAMTCRKKVLSQMKSSIVRSEPRFNSLRAHRSLSKSGKTTWVSWKACLLVLGHYGVLFGANGAKLVDESVYT